MNVLGTLRQTYLYTALTIAGGATVIALVALLGLGLSLMGLASTPPAPESVRESVSGGVAILLFSIPIGGIHLWLVLRSLGDPSERRSGPRHLFLNAWIVAGLFMAYVSVGDIARVVIIERTRNLAFPISSLVAGLAIALTAWRWRDAYGAARRDAQIIGAFATLGLATAAIAMEVAPLAGALLDALQGTTFYFAPRFVPALDAVWCFGAGLVAAVGLWSIGLRWQWSWRDVTFRTVYAATGFGLGLALVAIPGSDVLAVLIGVAVRGVDPSELRSVLSAPAIGVALVAMHLPWLLSDRGRIALPTRVTDRLVRGITAVCGLAALAIAMTAGGSVVVQDWLRLGPPQDDPLRVRDRAIATLFLAALLYPLSWRGFLRATAHDPRSGLRRAYILFVACVSLLGAIVAGVIAVTDLIQMALGATLTSSALRDTIDAVGWLVIFAAMLAAHLWMLLRDMGAARVVAPIASVRPVAVDPLDAILEDVAAGRIGTTEAAKKIRKLDVPVADPGKTA